MRNGDKRIQEEGECKVKYKECPWCSASLDFGEKCNCRDEIKRKEMVKGEIKDNESKEICIGDGGNHSNCDTNDILYQLRVLQEQLRCV